MQEILILGVKIDCFNNHGAAMEAIKNLLFNGKNNFIVTANPEIILKAQNDEEYFYILRHSDLNLPDGFGLKLAGLTMRVNPYRYTGADLTSELLGIAHNQNFKIGIVLWQNGLSKEDELVKLFKSKYPDLKFKIISTERNFDNWPINDMLQFKPDILLVALGAPWQEKFIFHNFKKIPALRLAVGIGGSFDFLTGKVKRSPALFRIAGLEWLWRLYKQPWRLYRIINAVVVFPYKFFIWRFILPYRYRNNTASLLYKKENGIYKILLVKRNDDENHWQLPQGGNDGLSVEEAGIKELSEELNCPSAYFKPLMSFKNLYKYNFINEKGFNAGKYKKTDKHLGYKGQRQSLLIAEFTGDDRQLKVNYWDHESWKWMESSQVVGAVHPCRQTSIKIYIEKFNCLINK